MEKKVLTPIQKGMILALILIVYAVAIYVTIPNINDQKSYNWASSVILIAGIVWACISFSKENNHNVTFGNVFAHGFKVTAVFTSIFLIYTILSLTVLFPDIKEKALQAAMSQMEEQGKMSDAQMDMALDFSKKYFMPLAIGSSLIGNLIVGAIGALIGAALAKKNPNPTPFESDNLS